MKKTLMTTLAAAAIGTAAVATAATPANAFVWWVVPAIAGGVVGGAMIGSAVNEHPAYVVGPPAGGTVYVRPAGAPPTCHVMRERVPGGWRHVQVCD